MYLVGRAAVHRPGRTDAQLQWRSTAMSAQAYYNQIVILGRRGSPTFAEAQRDFARLIEAARARPSA